MTEGLPWSNNASSSLEFPETYSHEARFKRLYASMNQNSIGQDPLAKDSPEKKARLARISNVSTGRSQNSLSDSSSKLASHHPDTLGVDPTIEHRALACGSPFDGCKIGTSFEDILTAGLENETAYSEHPTDRGCTASPPVKQPLTRYQNVNASHSSSDRQSNSSTATIHEENLQCSKNNPKKRDISEANSSDMISYSVCSKDKNLKKKCNGFNELNSGISRKCGGKFISSIHSIPDDVNLNQDICCETLALPCSKYLDTSPEKRIDLVTPVCGTSTLQVVGGQGARDQRDGGGGRSLQVRGVRRGAHAHTNFDKYIYDKKF
ncbi:uncharacterized protein LOC125179340 [Hyalella azteca]|uniref:Uncharacterized protein LOC125179340 n=1 Tax=Hyalella azteca TaxID=294128 RepID=A0A979FWN3_HYAAZ|nr:uncharacterized protein LOC125179340 [Hyalella azteca]